MEIGGVGHPRLIPILPTTFKMTFCMSMLSVPLQLKELMVLMSGQQSIRFSYQWMVPLWSPTKKTMLTEYVSIKFMCIHMYISKQAKSM